MAYLWREVYTKYTLGALRSNNGSESKKTAAAANFKYNQQNDFN